MTMIKGDKLPSLSSERLVLRWLEDRDAEALFEIFSDAQVMRYWSSPPWAGMADAVEMVESVRRYFAKGSLYQWGVACRSDDVVIGTCTLAEVDVQNRRAEIGFALRQDHWGQGYMTEALQRLLKFSFEELKLLRLEADVDPRNDASIRLLESLGFRREGYLRERWIVGDEISDTVFYGLLRSDWVGI